MKEQILNAIHSGIDTFISGMAPGTDIWAALEVLDLKASGEKVHLVCAVPYPGVEKNRTEEQKAFFAEIIKASDRVEYICPRYRSWCFSARNRWMVDNSSVVIAVFNGSQGGTANTIAYAEKLKRKAILIDDSKDLEFL